MTDGVQAAQQEATRWRRREQRLVAILDKIEDERRRLAEELTRVDEQVAYYDSLTREMKRELGRPGLSSFLSSLRKP